MGKRTLAIGDVHGCLTALTTLEKELAFSADDQIIMMGDYIDRGPKSMQVLDWLMEKQEVYDMITLMGNHELMMKDALIDDYDFQIWLVNGGIQTLLSFDTDFDEIPEKYWDFMENCKLYHETEKFIFVHGGPEPGEPLEEQSAKTLCWTRFRELKEYSPDKTIICGHTPQRSHIPGILPYAICIDTHAFNAEGWLTCLDVDTGEYWQANDKGEFRENSITMP